MAITQATRDALYRRAGGKCECTMTVCSDHRAGARCPKMLRGPWEAHHRSRTGGDGLGNLLAMCQLCHRNTRTYAAPR